jgi:RsiW-degrading membrane proteinase PrsW (M82 family)
MGIESHFSCKTLMLVYGKSSIDMDMIWGLVVLAIAPGIFWMYYFYHKDRCEPEPLSLIVELFVLGILVTVPVAFTENLFGLFMPELLLVVLIAPVVEELGKYFVVRRGVYYNREFNQPIDGIIYATAAALGFATLENVLYVFNSYLMSLPLAIGTGMIRAILSVPGHALFSIMWGSALGIAKFSPPARREQIILGGLFLAMFFHGVFNFLVMNSIGFAILVLVVVPLMWWMVFQRIHVAMSLCGKREL